MNQLTTFKSGYVALIGRPNVGKSTLLNCLLGEKLSIISPKPQTTRWQILGIKTLTAGQIIYVDTPGMHEDKRAINRYMNRVANAGMMDADVVVMMIDATRFKKEDEQVLNKLSSIEKPVILALNKVDLVKDKLVLLPLITKLHEKYKIAHIVPLSAKNGENTEQLEKIILELLPEGPALFPEDQLTDKTLRFQLAEIIREKLILVTGEELPYTTTVAIEEFKQTDKLTEIGAVIWVERTGQKIIVIGKGGTKLKKVGIKARREIESLLDTKVFLRLWVKVKENWTDDEKALRNLGYE